MENCWMNASSNVWRKNWRAARIVARWSHMPIDLVSELSSAAIRACALGLIAFASLLLFRVRSPAARHATWTFVLVGMLLQIGLGSVVPVVRLKVLPTASAPRQRATETTPRTPV